MREWLATLIRGYLRATRPHPGRGVLAKLAWRLDPVEFVHVVPSGYRFSICLADYGDVAIYSGTADLEDAHWVCEYLEPGDVVFDVGAHVGLFSIMCAKHVAPTGIVVAFEPVPRFITKLKRNLVLNEVTNVRVVPCALSDRRGEFEMYLDHDASSLFIRTGRKELVSVNTLDEFLEEHPELRAVKLIKLDVEGAELPVLKGSCETIKKVRPILLIELFPSRQIKAGFSCEEVFDFVTSLGYCGFIRRGHQTRKCPTYIPPPRGRIYENWLFIPCGL
ncbi:MAG: FkbM family methyltransferase [Candidatus Methanomethylicaceae archaeon]